MSKGRTFALGQHTSSILLFQSDHLPPFLGPGLLLIDAHSCFQYHMHRVFFGL